MNYKIEAGRFNEIRSQSGEWLIVDVGFSSTRKSCGVAKGDEDPYEITFGSLIKLAVKEAKTNDPKPLNLLLEAPLSSVFNDGGNPAGRSIDRNGRQHRYWYEGVGPLLVVASGYLLSELVHCDIQRDIRLFEGFVSFKRKADSLQSPIRSRSSHINDVKKLRDAVCKPADARIISPDALRISDPSIKSAFAFMGMDFGIPPVIFASP